LQAEYEAWLEALPDLTHPLISIGHKRIGWP
jgi:hypothetical protein